MTRLGADNDKPDRLGREPWRLTCFVLVFFVVWTVRAFVLASLDRRLQPPLARQLYLDVIRFLLWVVPVWIYVRITDRGDTARSLKLTTPIAWPGLFRGALISIVYFLIMISLGAWADGRRLASPLEFGPGYWLTRVLTMAGVCFAEELLFRGFLLPRVTTLVGFRTANVLTSALFTAVHWPGWLANLGFRAELAMMSLSVFAVGLLLGQVLKVTGSLWPCVAIHWFNNALAGLLVSPT